MQEFKFFISMDFDDLKVFTGRATKIFEKETDEVIGLALDNLDSNFNVVTSIKDLVVLIPEPSERRKLLNLSQRQLHLSRNMQETTTGLRVILDVYLDVRSGTTFSSATLINSIKSSLDTVDKREAFIVSLQLADSTFAPINSMTKFTINDEEIPVIEKSSIPWIYVGIAVGAAALILSIVAVFIIRRRRNEIVSFRDHEFSEDNIDTRISQ